MRSLVVIFIIAVTASRADAARGCRDTTAIVGREHCTRFGEWSRDSNVVPLAIDLGYMYRSFVSMPLASGELHSNGASLRILGRLDRWFYAGGDLGGAVIDGIPAGTSLLHMSLTDAHAIVGARISVMRLELAAEFAAGVRDAGTDYESPHEATTLELEARVHADWFVWPSASIGVTYGHSVLERDDQMIVISLGIHTRPIDGAYSPL